MNKIIVAPSILSADFANLERDINKVEEAGCDWIHVDVMDGHFVPNITIGAPVVKSIRKVTKLPLDVHLMIEDPDKYLDDFINAGSDIITIHYEAAQKKTEALLKKIKENNIKAGISIKPMTSPDVLKQYIELIDLVLVMSVEPGFGGQGFIPDSTEKISEINAMFKSANKDVIIEVDGGINAETGRLAIEAGATALVAGSYIYNATDISLAIKSLK